jgi:hypothetical protein
MRRVVVAGAFCRHLQELRVDVESFSKPLDTRRGSQHASHMPSQEATDTDAGRYFFMAVTVLPSPDMQAEMRKCVSCGQATKKTHINFRGLCRDCR